MKTILLLAALGAAFLLPTDLAQAADISPIPTGASLAYISPAQGTPYMGSVLSWKLTEKAFWNRFTADLLFTGKGADANTFLTVTPALGFEIVEVGKRLHLGATALLPKESGRFGWYVSWTLWP